MDVNRSSAEALENGGEHVSYMVGKRTAAADDLVRQL
jgi:hypothetical protein